MKNNDIIEKVKTMKKYLNNEMLDLLPWDTAENIHDLFDDILKESETEKINVIESDEKIIGVREELIKYLRHELVYTGSDSDIDIEDYARIVSETSYVLNKLLYDYTDEDNNLLLCLGESVFGGLDVKEVEI